MLLVGTDSLVEAADERAQIPGAAGIGQLAQGVENLLFGAFEIPNGILQGTTQGPLLLGTLQGALVGTQRTLQRTVTGISQVLRGTVQAASSLAPWAQYLLFFL